MVTALDIIGSDNSLQEHWIKRFVAIIIDGIIMAVIAWVIFWILPIPFWFGWGLGWSLLFGVIFFLYSTVMEMSSGSTLGKQVMNLRVISLHGQLETGAAFLRNISKIFFLALLLDWIVGFVTEGDPKQRFLDRNAGTTVIITDRLTHEQEHTYQSQQSEYAPPPEEQYAPQESPVYHYPQEQSAPQEAQEPETQEEQTCKDCGGRLVLMGNGRLQCIRCGRIY
jgi:uncharacterized RDD family membrane protein YckC